MMGVLICFLVLSWWDCCSPLVVIKRVKKSSLCGPLVISNWHLISFLNQLLQWPKSTLHFLYPFERPSSLCGPGTTHFKIPPTLLHIFSGSAQSNSFIFLGCICILQCPNWKQFVFDESMEWTQLRLELLKNAGWGLGMMASSWWISRQSGWTFVLYVISHAIVWLNMLEVIALPTKYRV